MATILSLSLILVPSDVNATVTYAWLNFPGEVTFTLGPGNCFWNAPTGYAYAEITCYGPQLGSGIAQGRAIQIRTTDGHLYFKISKLEFVSTDSVYWCFWWSGCDSGSATLGIFVDGSSACYRQATAYGYGIWEPLDCDFWTSPGVHSVYWYMSFSLVLKSNHWGRWYHYYRSLRWEGDYLG